MCGAQARQGKSEEWLAGIGRPVGNGRGAVPHAAEERLVERFCGGEAAAFDEVFRHYQTYIYHICLGILSDPDEAEDATQETFLRAHQGRTRFRGQASLTTWLYRIAVNTALRRDADRRRRECLPLEGEPAEEAGRDEAWAERVEEMERTRRVRAVLRGLPAAYRAVLVLRYFHELSLAEMAEVLSATVSSIKVRLHRARQAFHDRYHALFGEEDP
jgi:RNA polymerase sigma-70 factor (ECF subfamily)